MTDSRLDGRASVWVVLLMFAFAALDCGGSTRRIPPGCSVSHPKLVDRGQIPLYTDEARRAGAQGRQVVTLQIDEDWTVEGASFDRLLGHGLDERVLTFARTMHFTPATQCDQPVTSTFRIRFNFELGP